MRSNTLLCALMPRVKTKIREAAGQLTSAVQKEWGLEIGEEGSELSEEVMNLSHDFLQAKSGLELDNILSGKSVTEYLGKEWVAKHQSVIPFIVALEKSR